VTIIKKRDFKESKIEGEVNKGAKRSKIKGKVAMIHDKMQA